MEDGRIRFCAKDMKEPELDDNLRSDRVKRLIKSYQQFHHKNNRYSIKFFLCEGLNLLNVFIQIFCINEFIGRRFLDYGSQILNFYTHIKMGIDPMVEVFPKVTKCQFNRHGPGGDINNHDALCLLPLNIVNEKIYLVMWLWLIVLAGASTVAVIYRLTCLIVPEVMTLLIWRQPANKRHVAEVCRNGQCGDWFLLRRISKNVDQETFNEFVYQLNKEISQRKPDEPAHQTPSWRPTSV